MPPISTPRSSAGWRDTCAFICTSLPPARRGSTWWNASFATSLRIGSGVAYSATWKNSSWPSAPTSTVTTKVRNHSSRWQHPVAVITPGQSHEIVLLPGLVDDLEDFRQRFLGKEHFVITAGVRLGSMAGGNFLGHFGIVLSRRPHAD